MQAIISEKEYQQYIITRLNDAGYEERVAKEKYDKRFAMDTEVLLEFLEDTQLEAMEKLRKIYKEGANDLIIAKINQHILESSLLDALKYGVEINGVKLELMYNRPATSFNPTLGNLYHKTVLR